jgi:hypothetical protein
MDIRYISIRDGVPGEGFDRIALDAIALLTAAESQHLDRGRADVHPQQGHLVLSEQ